jgi:hypothetical protein
MSARQSFHDQTDMYVRHLEVLSILVLLPHLIGEGTFIRKQNGVAALVFKGLQAEMDVRQTHGMTADIAQTTL